MKIKLQIELIDPDSCGDCPLCDAEGILSRCRYYHEQLKLNGDKIVRPKKCKIEHGE